MNSLIKQTNLLLCVCVCVCMCVCVCVDDKAIPWVVRKFMRHLVENRYKPLFDSGELSHSFHPFTKAQLCGVCVYMCVDACVCVCVCVRSHSYTCTCTGQEFSMPHTDIDTHINTERHTHIEIATKIMNTHIDRVCEVFVKFNLLSTRYINLFNYVELIAYYANDIEYVPAWLMQCLPYIA